MALLLDGTMALKNSAVTLTRPFIVGAWVMCSGTTAYPIFLTEPVSSDTVAIFEDDTGLFGTANALILLVSGAGGAEFSFVPLARNENVWLFVLAREISASNRTLSILDSSTGAITHVSDVTSVTLPAIDRMIIGGSEAAGSLSSGFTGSIAEVWYGNIDPQVDGGQMDDTLMRQLAYGGPFSVPHVGQAVQEYRSFRKCTNSSMDEVGEVFAGNGLGPQTWAEFGSSNVARGSHPPLPYWYVRPGQNKTLLVI